MSPLAPEELTALLPQVVDLPTGQGPGRAHVSQPARPVGRALLGHGAGGGLGSLDLLAAAQALIEAGWSVAVVEQPWLVAGRRVAGRPPTLDDAWLAMAPAVLGSPRRRTPVLLGGRSAGARVACRTAAALGADAVLALSFPLHPPGAPDRSRAGEARCVLDAGLPLLVTQGERDPFGTPDEVRSALQPAAGAEAAGIPLEPSATASTGLSVVPVAGTHTVTRTGAASVGAAVAAFARELAG